MSATQVSQEEKTGVLDLFYDGDTGSIKEDGSNTPRDFYHPGAQTEFVIGDSVSYMILTLPNGRVIVKDIKHR